MKIYVYTTPNCPQCQTSKTMLNNAKVVYTEVDVSQDEAAMQLVKELGYASAPVVVFDSTHWSGFRHEKLENLITRYRSFLVQEAA
jgi:glutaredoxin-like protein NrdH|tara:strand:- start:2140 stop:2397 length:258 start_codon:yes stop_codon:yes gene_type:complete